MRTFYTFACYQINMGGLGGLLHVIKYEEVVQQYN